MFEMVTGTDPLFDSVTVLAGLLVPTTLVPKLRLVVDMLSVGVTPEPVREINCGLFEALSVIVNMPLRKPLAVGVKVTLTVQLELAPTLAPQLLVCAKSPLACIPLMLVAVGPGFDRVTGCEPLALPSACAAKLSAAGVAFRTFAPPVPVSDTVCGLPEALSVMVRVPVRVPVAVGVNVTLTVQLVLTARLVPQLLLCAKSPLAVMLAMFAAAVPVFDTVTGCDALLLPSTCAAKVSVLVDTAITGAVPVPVSETVCGLFEALSVMVSAPVREPLAVGVNVTLTVQLELAPTLAPQLLVCAKSPLACMPVTEMEVPPGFDSVTGCEALVVPTCCAA